MVASKCLTTGWGWGGGGDRERRKEALFEAFADFCGVNTPSGLISNLPIELKNYIEIGVITLRSRCQSPALAPSMNHSRLREDRRQFITYNKCLRMRCMCA